MEMPGQHKAAYVYFLVMREVTKFYLIFPVMHNKNSILTYSVASYLFS